MRRPGGFDGGGQSDTPDPRELGEPDRGDLAGEREALGADPEGAFGLGGGASPIIGAPGVPVAPVVPVAAVGPGDEPDADATVPLDDAVALVPGVDAVADGPAEVVRAPQGLLGLLTRRTGDPVLEAERRLKRAEQSRRARERRDRRRFTAHARRRRRNWMIALSAVAALALFVIVGVFTPLMAVRDVQVVGATQVNVEDVQTAMSRFEGMPLALVDDREVHRALEPFALIQRYAIERIPPHTLLIRIEERDAVVALERDGALGLFDPAGVLVGTATERPEGVPVGSGAVADTASPAFQAAGTVIRDMPEDVRSQLAAVEASSAQDVEFVLVSGTRVFWGEADETQRKAAVLRAMLASVGQATVIDLSAPETPVFK